MHKSLIHKRKLNGGVCNLDQFSTDSGVLNLSSRKSHGFFWFSFQTTDYFLLKVEFRQLTPFGLRKSQEVRVKSYTIKGFESQTIFFL